MGLFGTTSPFDADVDKATNENNTVDQWDIIMNICDKVGSNSKNSKDCLRSIMRRLAHNDPHVCVQAITLLDACINNCGKLFHLEIASREFETEFRKLLGKHQKEVGMKMKLSLKKWAESEFKTDPQLNLIPSLYQKLKEEGQEFTDSSAQPVKQIVLSKDPDVVSSQQEQDDIAKAIELSLKEKGGSPKTNSTTSLYPAMSAGSTASSLAQPQQQRPVDARKVRALYDFEAAEDNELTFLAGEIIHLVDDSDANWWKGYNHRGEGLFPSNFVTADLSAEPETFAPRGNEDKTKKSVQFPDELKKEAEDELIEINEERIDRLLHLLHEANPEDPSQDSEEMLQLESQVNQMLPLIDTELERVDRKHAQLTQLSSDLVEAINLYHTLMREPDRSLAASFMGSAGGYPSAQHMRPGQLPANGIYASLPPNMYQMPGVSNLPSNMMPMGPAQHLQMMPGYGIPGGQLPPLQMIPPHLQNGHQGHINQSNMQPPPSSMMQQQQAQQQMTNHPMGPQMHQQPQMLPPTSIPQQQQSQLQNQHISLNPQAPASTQQQQQISMNHMNQQLGGQYSMAQTNFPQHLQNQMPQQLQHQQQPPTQQQQPQPPQPLSHNMNMSLSQQHLHHSYQQHPSGMQQMSLPNQQQPQNPSPIHMIAANMAMAQPVTNTILPQSDSRTNIPIYQQQR